MADESFPSSKGVVAVAGTQPLPIFIDLNKDGTNDLEQLRALAAKHQPIAETALRMALFFLPKHTLLATYLESYFSQFKPKVDLALGVKT